MTTGREKEKADLYSISVLIGVVWLRAYIHNCITYKPFLLWYVLVIPPLSFLGTYFFLKKKSELISTFPPLPPPGPPAPKKKKKRKGFSDVLWFTRFMFVFVNALLLPFEIYFAFTFYFYTFYLYPFLPPRGDMNRSRRRGGKGG